MVTPMNDPDHYAVESDDENTDPDGLLSSIFNQVRQFIAYSLHFTF